MNILGVKIDNLSREKIFEKIEGFLSGNKFSQIATVNPEFILKAQEDGEFKKILNNCDLSVADGVGIKFAFWKYGKKLKARIAGVDLMQEILKIASDRGLGIFLVASKDGLSTWEETAKAIKNIYPNLRIGGSNIEKFGNWNLEIGNCENYLIIFTNHGAPYQEKFLHSLKTPNNSKIRLTMGVGGSFDYLTGKTKRAPKWMRQLGLEWLFRLILEPKYRFKRIFRAIITFPIKILFSKKTNE